MSRRRLFLALCLALVMAEGSVLAAGGTVQRGHALPSMRLGRDVPYAIYLPPGYGTTATTRRYPVLFLLHGLGGQATDWLDAGGLARSMDGLIANGAIPSMIVVMPGLGDGWYVDNLDPGGLGPIAAAFLDDVVPGIDRVWQTSGVRAVAGLSMGGWGAVRFAMLRPDRFVAAASLSGAIVTPAQAETAAWEELFSGAFGRPFAIERFLAATPERLLPAFAATPTRPALFLTCGDDDALDLALGNLHFFRAARATGVAAELRITDGGHDWSLWARELPTVLRFVGSRMPPG